jgi:hypothetical protein
VATAAIRTAASLCSRQRPSSAGRGLEWQSLLAEPHFADADDNGSATFGHMVALFVERHHQLWKVGVSFRIPGSLLMCLVAVLIEHISVVRSHRRRLLRLRHTLLTVGISLCVAAAGRSGLAARCLQARRRSRGAQRCATGGLGASGHGCVPSRRTGPHSPPAHPGLWRQHCSRAATRGRLEPTNLA